MSTNCVECGAIVFILLFIRWQGQLGLYVDALGMTLARWEVANVGET